MVACCQFQQTSPFVRPRHTMPIRPNIILLALLFVVAAYATALADPIQISTPWARATPPGATTGAVYLTLENSGTADRLLGVSSDAAERTEIHVHEHSAGMMRMKPVNGVDIGAGEAVAFEPGGRHIMLIGLTRPLMPDATLELILRFASGIEVTVTVPIRDMRR